MAQYNSIPDAWIVPGEALKKRTFVRIKDNLDDHESRLNSVEQGVSKVSIFNFELIGYISNYSAADLVGIGTYRSPQNLTITEAKIILLNSSSTPSIASSAGSLIIDLQKSSDGGVTWSSILLELPTIGDGQFLAGEESTLVSFIPGGELLLQDELIRVSVISKKDTQGSFQILVYGDLS